MTPQFATTTVASRTRVCGRRLRAVAAPAFWECVADVVAELRAAADPEAQLIDIAYWSRASQGAISRFERHESQPRDLDRLVVAYAKVCGADAAQIMREAIDRWEAAGGADLPTNPLTRLGPAEALEVEADRLAAQRRRSDATSKRSRRRATGS